MSQQNARKAADSLNLLPQVCPFANYIDDWLVACKASRRSQKTIKGYGEVLTKFLWWYKDTGYYAALGSHPRYVTRREIREFITYLQEPNSLRWGVAPTVNNGFRDRLSSATITYYARTVRVFFNWLVNEEHLTATPFNRVEIESKKHDQTLKLIPRSDMTKLFSFLLTKAESGGFTARRALAWLALSMTQALGRVN